MERFTFSNPFPEMDSFNLKHTTLIKKICLFAIAIFALFIFGSVVHLLSKVNQNEKLLKSLTNKVILADEEHEESFEDLAKNLTHYQDVFGSMVLQNRYGIAGYLTEINNNFEDITNNLSQTKGSLICFQSNKF